MAANKKGARKKGKGDSLVSDPAGVSPSRDYHHVSIRRIDNGYMVSEHGTRRGKSFDRDRYTAQKPVIAIGGKKNTARQRSTGKRLSEDTLI